MGHSWDSWPKLATHPAIDARGKRGEASKGYSDWWRLSSQAVIKHDLLSFPGSGWTPSCPWMAGNEFLVLLWFASMWCFCFASKQSLSQTLSSHYFTFPSLSLALSEKVSSCFFCCCCCVCGLVLFFTYQSKPLPLCPIYGWLWIEEWMRLIRSIFVFFSLV